MIQGTTLNHNDKDMSFDVLKKLKIYNKEHYQLKIVPIKTVRKYLANHKLISLEAKYHL